MTCVFKYAFAYLNSYVNTYSNTDVNFQGLLGAFHSRDPSGHPLEATPSTALIYSAYCQPIVSLLPSLYLLSSLLSTYCQLIFSLLTAYVQLIFSLDSAVSGGCPRGVHLDPLTHAFDANTNECRVSPKLRPNCAQLAQAVRQLPNNCTRGDFWASFRYVEQCLCDPPTERRRPRLPEPEAAAWPPASAP